MLSLERVARVLLRLQAGTAEASADSEEPFVLAGAEERAKLLDSDPLGTLQASVESGAPIEFGSSGKQDAPVFTTAMGTALVRDAGGLGDALTAHSQVTPLLVCAGVRPAPAACGEVGPAAWRGGGGAHAASARRRGRAGVDPSVRHPEEAVPAECVYQRWCSWQ